MSPPSIIDLDPTQATVLAGVRPDGSVAPIALDADSRVLTTDNSGGGGDASAANQVLALTALDQIYDALQLVGTEATSADILAAVNSLSGEATLGDLAIALAPLATQATQADILTALQGQGVDVGAIKSAVDLLVPDLDDVRAAVQSMDAKAPSLVGGAVPVVLPAGQISALTPLSSVAVSNFPATQPVSGPVTDAQLRATAVPVSGPLTDTQIRASALPVSATALTDGSQIAIAKGPIAVGAPAGSEKPVLLGGVDDSATVQRANVDATGAVRLQSGGTPGATAPIRATQIAGVDTAGKLRQPLLDTLGQVMLGAQDFWGRLQAERTRLVCRGYMVEAASPVHFSKLEVSGGTVTYNSTNGT